MASNPIKFYAAVTLDDDVALMTVESHGDGNGGWRVRRGGVIVGRAGFTGCGEVDALADALANVLGVPVPVGADVTTLPQLQVHAAANGVDLYAAGDIAAALVADVTRKARRVSGGAW